MKGRVFIVDDDPIMGNLLEVQLSDAGFDAEYFNSAGDALEKICLTEPDRKENAVVISDTEMPGMNGFELHLRMRENPGTSGIPFVFLSARTDPPAADTDRLEGHAAVADDFVCKPFRMEDLLARAERVMALAAEARVFENRNDFQGDLSRTDIFALLRIITLNHKSGELLIRNSGNELRGSAFFRYGILVAARTDFIKGEEAFLELMGERHGHFEFYGRLPDIAEQISDSTALLSKAGRFFKEYEHLSNRIPNPDIRLTLRSGDVSQEAEENAGRKNVRKILSMIGAGQTVREILDNPEMSRLRVAYVLAALLEKENPEAGQDIPKLEIPEPEILEPEIPESEIPESEILDLQILDPEVLDLEILESEISEPEIPESEILEPEIPESEILDLQISEPEISEPEISEPPPDSRLPPVNDIDEELTIALKDAERREMTGKLDIGNTMAKAAVFFEKGRVVHAYHGKAKGKKALYRIFSEKGGTFEFLPMSFGVTHTISDPLGLLFEEGNREIGILNRLDPGSLDKIIRTDDRISETMGDMAARSALTYVLTLTQQHSRVKDIIDASQMSDLSTYKHLLHLVRKGVLVVEGEKKAEVRVVTDSAADLPDELLRAGDIICVPVSSEPDFPDTRERDFHAVFREITPDRDVAGIFVSKKMAGVFESAMAARHRHYDKYLGSRERKDSGKLRLEIIDSGLISLGTGLLVLEAAEKARQGWSADHIRNYVGGLIPSVRVFFVADTWTSARRVGPADTSALLGHLLRTKPVFAVRNGEIGMIDQVRNHENARQVILELMEQSLDHPRTRVSAGVMHASAEEQAARMKDLLEDHFNCRDIVMSRIGPLFERYCGPGTVAVAYLPLGD